MKSLDKLMMCYMETLDKLRILIKKRLLPKSVYVANHSRHMPYLYVSACNHNGIINISISDLEVCNVHLNSHKLTSHGEYKNIKIINEDQ